MVKKDMNKRVGCPNKNDNSNNCSNDISESYEMLISFKQTVNDVKNNKNKIKTKIQAKFKPISVILNHIFLTFLIFIKR